LELIKKRIGVLSVAKQFTSWGGYCTVVTKDKTYHNVIVCPSPNNWGKTLLEYYNGDVIEIDTTSITSVAGKS